MKKKYFTSKNILSNFYNFFENSFSQIFKKLVFVCFAFFASLASSQISKFNYNVPHISEVKSFTAVMNEFKQNSRSVSSKAALLKIYIHEKFLNNYLFVVE